MQRHLRLLATAAAFVLSGSALAAHDMWIEPTSFAPAAGQIVGVKLRVGQDLLGDPIARDASLIEQFIVADGSGSKPVIGHDGSDPAGYLRASSPGLLVVGYYSNPSAVELPAEKFNAYLKDEGLDTVAALRARSNQTASPARELFTRCAKSLILSGAATASAGDRALGFPLELVAERNPYTLQSGQDFGVRLTYEDHPLAGALVVALNRSNGSVKLAARSDADGRVHFHLSKGGMWMIKAVHMIPAPAGSRAEWASFWASLTFQLKDQI